MQISKEGLDLIKEFEGLSLKAYPDVRGVYTIGYGHTRDAIPGMVIDAPTAVELLLADTGKCEIAIDKNVKVPLKQCQFDALVSLIFNIGISAFINSTLLRKINNKAPLEAIEKEWLRWCHVAKVVSKGLSRRRRMEFKLYRKC